MFMFTLSLTQYFDFVSIVSVYCVYYNHVRTRQTSKN